MNAHSIATTQAPLDTTPDHAPAWARYIPSVAAFLPGCTEQEARDRAGLMLLRDMASAARVKASWQAEQALVAIENIAREHCLAPMTGEALTATRLALVKLWMGVRRLEEVFGDHGGR